MDATDQPLAARDANGGLKVGRSEATEPASEDTRVPVDRLIIAMARALDLARPESPQHHLRVAYFSIRIARRAAMAKKDLTELFLAASVHDIGITGMRDDGSDSFPAGLAPIPWHAEAGQQLLHNHPLLAGAARAIRYHHLPWSAGRGQQCDGEPVPPASNVIALAEEIDRAIRMGVPILQQKRAIVESICAHASRRFRDEFVEAFRQCAKEEAFWLDCVSAQLEQRLLEQALSAAGDVGETALGPVAEILGRVVDGLSPWTATHSAAVAGACVALAELMEFSPPPLLLMRAAGYLHDLGKLSIRPVTVDAIGQLSPRQRAIIRGHPYHTFRILEGLAGPLDLSEWAGFHHERLDGTGYPFRRSGGQLTLGARIMAVADVFAALTEGRPHRKAVSPAGAISVLERLADSSQLDGDVVGLLSVHREMVAAACEKEKLTYQLRYHGLGEYAKGAAE